MSMSMHVVAIKPADEDYRKKLAAYRACEEAGVAIPGKLLEFFNHEEPDETGMKQDLNDHACVCDWSDESRNGFQVDITRLPPGTRYVRLFCSW